MPLRSPITKGRGGHYPYYLCQTKGGDHSGKSIKRDQAQREVDELIKKLQPTEGLMTLATAMFRHIWCARQEQAQEILQAGKSKIAVIDTEFDKLIDTITIVCKAAVIHRYEEQIDASE